MILIYSQLPFDKQHIDEQINLLKDRYSVFFVDDNSFLYSTESNQLLLKEIVINHNVGLFYLHSIKEMVFSVVEIIGLITYLVNNGCRFQTEKERLYFCEYNIDEIESMVSEFCKDQLVSL